MGWLINYWDPRFLPEILPKSSEQVQNEFGTHVPNHHDLHPFPALPSGIGRRWKAGRLQRQAVVTLQHGHLGVPLSCQGFLVGRTRDGGGEGMMAGIIH